MEDLSIEGHSGGPVASPVGNGDALALRQQFHALYDAAPRIFCAPGRVNLIGEHTDYNEGFVMPAAIDSYVWAAISPRTDYKLRVHSINYSESVEVDLGKSDALPRSHWSDYVHGVVLMLRRAGVNLTGANLLLRGDFPVGSGLSSSAAVEVATALALSKIAGANIDRVTLAKLCRQAETEFVGARVGIMDQFIACFGRPGYAMMLDCRSLEFRHLPIPLGAELVICDTMVKHELAASEYNTRRAECEAGVQILSRFLSGITALRDVTIMDLERHRDALPLNIYRRTRHVITENTRVTSAAEALEKRDCAAFGHLMNESHRSLRDDYEVSCIELDQMVEFASQVQGVFGARMTGGGFGGCTINLVKTEAVSQFKRHVAQSYEHATMRMPRIFVCRAAEGASEIK
jgi:galactokinase